jgi:NTP pyrophosphatase (non-canonical NTP hydrolase)
MAERPIPSDADIPMHGWQPYGDVHRERMRAHEKHSASGRSCEQMEVDDPDWLPVLVEEVGEVANAMIEDAIFRGGSSRTHLRKELVQVAAMATAWIDAIDAEQ